MEGFPGFLRIIFIIYYTKDEMFNQKKKFKIRVMGGGTLFPVEKVGIIYSFLNILVVVRTL